MVGQYTEKVKGTSITLTGVINVATSDARASVKAVPKIDIDPHSSALLENVKLLLRRLSGHSLALLGTEVLQMANSTIGEEGDASDTGLSTWLSATSD